MALKFSGLSGFEVDEGGLDVEDTVGPVGLVAEGDFIYGGGPVDFCDGECEILLSSEHVGGEEQEVIAFAQSIVSESDKLLLLRTTTLDLFVFPAASQDN